MFYTGKLRNAIFTCATMNGTRFLGLDVTGAVFGGTPYVTNTDFMKDLNPKPVFAAVNCGAPIALPSDYPRPTPTTAVPPTIAPTTLPATTVPASTVAPPASKPLTVAALPGKTCPNDYSYIASGASAGSCGLLMAELSPSTSCPAGWGGDFVANNIRYCFLMAS